MTDVITRRDLLRRAAASGAFLSVPGILAACGGTSSKSASSSSRTSSWSLRTQRASRER